MATLEHGTSDSEAPSEPDYVVDVKFSLDSTTL
jgi:hypothetical protein